MGIILLCIIVLYLFFAISVFSYVRSRAKTKKVIWIVGSLLVLFPFKHQIFFGTLFGIYGLRPLQVIQETVEYPHSVYWEDNVWPGFDEYGRHWMVKNYLDGIHLKELALNGDDGKIYFYRATEKDVFERAQLRKRIRELREERSALEQKGRDFYRENGRHDQAIWETLEKKIKPKLNICLKRYGELSKVEVKRVTENAEKYASVSALPPMKYHVVLSPIHNVFLLTKLYHADQIQIIDAQQNEVKAYSKRYMAYAPWISKVSGEQPKFGKQKGDIRVYEFVHEIISNNITLQGVNVARTRDLIERNHYKLIQ